MQHHCGRGRTERPHETPRDRRMLANRFRCGVECRVRMQCYILCWHERLRASHLPPLRSGPSAVFLGVWCTHRESLNILPSAGTCICPPPL
eukprot:scaffold131389_cov27-Tisochrysis_lutea.AAC.3